MKHFFLYFSLLIGFSSYSQNLAEYEKPPVFPNCESREIAELKSCFYNELSAFVFNNFETPQIVTDNNYKGKMVVLFEVDAQGEFVVLYVDAIYEELKTEAKNVFSKLPKIQPATYNGKATYPLIWSIKHPGNEIA